MFKSTAIFVFVYIITGCFVRFSFLSKVIVLVIVGGSGQIIDVAFIVVVVVVVVVVVTRFSYSWGLPFFYSRKEIN